MTSQPRAFVLLYIVLVVASITASMALAAGLGSTFTGNRIRSDTQNATVRMLAMRCGETVLMIVRTTTSTTGTGTITNDTGTCSYTISGTAPAKTITITATQYNLYKRLTITTTQVTPTILSTWVEGS